MPYAPGVQDMSGQILGQSIAQAGQDIGAMMKARKEEEKQHTANAKAYDALLKYATQSNNKDLLGMLDPSGVGSQGMSIKDKSLGLMSGLQAFQVGQQVQQMAAEKQRADVAAMQLGLEQDKLRQRQAGYTFSPLLGRDATADEVVSANNAYAQLLGRDVSPERAVSMLGGDMSYFSPNTTQTAPGTYQSKIPSWLNMGAGDGVAPGQSGVMVGGAVPAQSSISPEQASSLLNSYIQSQRSPIENFGSAAGAVGNAVAGAIGGGLNKINYENQQVGRWGVFGQPGRVVNDLLSGFSRYRGTDEKANQAISNAQLKKMTPEQLAAFIEQLSQLKTQAKGAQKQAVVNQKEIDNLMPDSKKKPVESPANVASMQVGGYNVTY